MGNNKVDRLSPQEMRDIMLANTKVLMSDRFRTIAPEVTGQKKKVISTLQK